MTFIASMPMYDPPEERETVDLNWRRVRDALRLRGIAAPERLVRRNADLPAVPGGIRDVAGNIIAPDPATLPPEELDLHTLWHHPDLLFGETCWGPLEQGLRPFVHVIAQNSYSGVPGGEGILYRSALITRSKAQRPTPVPSDTPVMPDLAGRHFAFNTQDSRSGYLSVERDLHAQGASMRAFSRITPTGSHLASLRMVAASKADIAAIDCKSWAMAQRHHPSLSAKLHVAGWTAPSTGLPFICSVHLPEAIRRNVADVARAIFLPPARC